MKEQIETMSYEQIKAVIEHCANRLAVLYNGKLESVDIRISEKDN